MRALPSRPEKIETIVEEPPRSSNFWARSRRMVSIRDRSHMSKRSDACPFDCDRRDRRARAARRVTANSANFAALLILPKVRSHRSRRSMSVTRSVILTLRYTHSCHSHSGALPFTIPTPADLDRLPVDELACALYGSGAGTVIRRSGAALPKKLSLISVPNGCTVMSNRPCYAYKVWHRESTGEGRVTCKPGNCRRRHG